MKSEHARQVYKVVKKEMGKSNDPETVVWGVVEGVAAVLDGINQIPIVGPAAGVAQMIKTGIDGTDDLIDNPYFTGNGHGEDDASAATKKYLKGRLAKNLAAGGASVAGAVGSVWTQVDVAGLVMHGNATGTTIAHLAVLGDMARKVKKGRGSKLDSKGSLEIWLETLIKMKAIKQTVRGTSLIGSAVPIPAVGITTGLVAAAVNAGGVITMSKTCVATSLSLHWRVWQEQWMSNMLGGGTGQSVGPASRMVYELFTKRGMTRILGKHEVDAMMKEPAGWMAINDKLLLI